MSEFMVAPECGNGKTHKYRDYETAVFFAKSFARDTGRRYSVYELQSSHWWVSRHPYAQSTGGVHRPFSVMAESTQ